jgi:hypothetical protein
MLLSAWLLVRPVRPSHIATITPFDVAASSCQVDVLHPEQTICAGEDNEGEDWDGEEDAERTLTTHRALAEASKALRNVASRSVFSISTRKVYTAHVTLSFRR